MRSMAFLLRNSLALINRLLGTGKVYCTAVQSNTSLLSQTINVSLYHYHTSVIHYRTIGQIIRQGPVKRKPKKKSALSGRPQLRGIVQQTLIKKPKKPNSAQRKCCRVKLSTGKIIIAHIPYEGHTLQEGNVVLIRGGRAKDIGTKYKVIRGKYDCGHPIK